jgi:hypothetical protein
MNVTFVDASHEYLIDSARVPGVTSTLSKVGLAPSFDMLPDDILEDARLRGILVHRAIEQYEKTGMEIKFEHPELHRLKVPFFFDAYRRWRDKEVDYVIACERICAHLTFRYCGRLDLFAVMKDGRILITDAKTGASGPWSLIQQAAYLQALKSEGIEANGYGLLKLNNDGTYKQPSYGNDFKYFQVFLAALTVVNFGRNGKS